MIAATAIGEAVTLPVAALLRRTMWRVVLWLAGGLRTVGRFPTTPCVVVANHCSHADVPALLAALPATSRPVVAAAADYWFGQPVRGWICRTLVSGFPVRRDGGGSADLQAAVTALRAGRSVIVFPEGTRARAGALREFHTGAFRLAAHAGVPVVPVWLGGTGELLPVHGTPHRGQVTVQVGSPLVNPSAAEARDAVAALAVPRRQRLSAATRVRRVAMSRWGLLGAFAWAVAEAVSWPFVPEVLLGVLLLARLRWRRAVVLVGVAAAGSVAGCALTYALAAGGHAPPAPLTTPRMASTVAQQTAAEGATAVRHQPWSGIPVKVYAAEAGRRNVPAPTFLATVAWVRMVRIATVALFVGSLASLVPRRAFVPAVVAALAFFGTGLVRVVASWS